MCVLNKETVDMLNDPNAVLKCMQSRSKVSLRICKDRVFQAK